MKFLSPPFVFFVVFYCSFCCAGLLLGQTSPKGTFKIESSIKEGRPDSGEAASDFIVSTSDPSARELLNEYPAENPTRYFISPDEQWIFATIHFGSRMGGGQLFKRQQGLKFQPAKPQSLAELAWQFFAEKEEIAPEEIPFLQSHIGIIDFVAWSPDSVRLLLALRGGDFEDEHDRGVYLWYLYFNAKTEKLELTSYLRHLNKDAWKRWKNFGEKEAPTFPEAASAEPLGELAPQTELKKRYEEEDWRLNEVYQQVLSKIDKEQQGSLRDDQRHCIKTRDAGMKLYKESGDKSTAEQRYWQYMLDSTETQLRHIETDWKPTIESQ